MKNYFLAFLACILSLTTIAKDSDTKAENLGLISELVYIKLTSENFAIKVISDSTITIEGKNVVTSLNAKNSLNRDKKGLKD